MVVGTKKSEGCCGWNSLSMSSEYSSEGKFPPKSSGGGSGVSIQAESRMLTAPTHKKAESNSTTAWLAALTQGLLTAQGASWIQTPVAEPDIQGSGVAIGANVEGQ